MGGLKRVPSLDGSPVQNDGKATRIAVDKSVKHHAEMGTDFLKTQVERLLSKTCKTAQFVNPIPDYDRPGGASDEPGDEWMIRQGIGNESDPTAFLDYIYVETNGFISPAIFVITPRDCSARATQS